MLRAKIIFQEKKTEGVGPLIHDVLILARGTLLIDTLLDKAQVCIIEIFCNF